MPGDFHFIRPWWLLALVPLVVFLVWFARRRFAMRRWRDIVDPALMPHVLIGAGYQTRRRVTVLLGLAGVLMIGALAGPAWQRLPQPVFRSQDSLVIALDLSRSMDAADVKPSRLSRARFKINDILSARDEGQSALIVFAADAYIVSPLTDDAQTIILQLPALQTALMPGQGSRADRALEKAGEVLRQAGATGGHVLLVTDGVNAARDGEVAAELRESGSRVSVLGIGTEAGGPIPGRGGFVKRDDGSIVLAQLDERAMSDVAAAGGGAYQRLAANESDIERLLADFDARTGRTEETGLEADVWREEGPWLLLPLLPLAALAFRRGVIAFWLLVFVLPPRPAEAFDWVDLWSRPDQRASAMMQDDDAAAAADLFEDPEWRGAAAYRAERFEDSLAALDGLDGIEPTYNRGNALAKLGRFDEAIAAYDEVLERDRDHRDARYNRDLLREQMQQQQPQDGEGDGEQQSQPQDEQSQQSAEQSGDDSAQQSAQQREQRGQPDGTGADQPSAGDEQTSDDGQRQADSEESTTTPRQSQEDQPPVEQAGTDAGERESEQSLQAASDRESMPDEEAQAMEQWLRKIPDDPGGLLRRKFYYQYQQQPRPRQEDEQW